MAKCIFFLKYQTNSLIYKFNVKSFWLPNIFLDEVLERSKDSTQMDYAIYIYIHTCIYICNAPFMSVKKYIIYIDILSLISWEVFFHGLHER